MIIRRGCHGLPATAVMYDDLHFHKVILQDNFNLYKEIIRREEKGKLLKLQMKFHNGTLCKLQR